MLVLVGLRAVVIGIDALLRLGVSIGKPDQDNDGAETTDQAIQAVLGAGMAREMGNDFYKRPLEPGDYFEIGPREWVVTGVLDSAGSTFDSEVWVKMQIAGPMFGKENWTTCILRTTVPESSGKIAEALTTEVLSRK